MRSLFSSGAARAGLLAMAISLVPVSLVGMSSMALAEDVTPFKDTSRLVSIGGSLTEIIFALGEQGRLVARDSTASFPEAAEALPDVGYMRALAPEGVLSVNPTALLVIEGSGPPEVLEVLEQSGVPYQTVPEGYSHQGILTKVTVIGDALGIPEKAADLVAKLDAELTVAEDATKDIETPKRVLFILSMRTGKIQASGSGTAADAIITLAGAQNAITEYSGYKALTEEAIINARPDVILMMDRGDHGAVDDELFANPAIALTPAGRDHAVIRMNGAYLLNFGPRAAAAIHDLATALYGDQAHAK